MKGDVLLFGLTGSAGRFYSSPRRIMTDNEKGLASFPATSVTVQHTSIATGLSYDDLVGGFERELGRWDLAAADPGCVKTRVDVILAV